MTFLDIVKRAEKLTIDNSPLILTSIGVTGTLTMAFLTGKATLRATELIAAEQERLDRHETSHPLERKEKIKLVWKEYLPAAGVGVVTVACIIGANRIGMRRTAAMATALSVSQQAIAEYRDKVVEKIGERKEQDIRDEIMHDRVNANPPGQIIRTGTGETLCYDSYTGRYFWSSMEALKKAENDVNFQVLHEDYASLTDFYHRIGLGGTATSDDVGWTTDKRLEVEYTSTLFEERLPCLALNFLVTPVRGYNRFG